MTHFTPEFVNRQAQVEAFGHILAGGLQREIFLVHGTAEIGKSFLLEQFMYMAGRRQRARVDFRDGEVHSFLSLIQTAVRDLGAAAFPATTAAITRMTTGARHDIVVQSEEVHQAQPINRAKLRQLLLRAFGEGDLRDLCFDMAIDYDELPGDGTGNKVRELIIFLERRTRLAELLTLGQTLRPHAPWHEVTKPPISPFTTPLESATRAVFRDGAFFPPLADPLQKQALQGEISFTFFDELSRLAQPQTILLSYDSYEDAPAEVWQWLTGVLLDEVVRGHLPGVMVLIAGRKVPLVTHMMKPKTILTALEPFDLATVQEYWVQRRQLSADQIEEIYRQTAGHPQRVAEQANAAGGLPLRYQVMVI